MTTVTANPYRDAPVPADAPAEDYRPKILWVGPLYPEAMPGSDDPKSRMLIRVVKVWTQVGDGEKAALKATNEVEVVREFSRLGEPAWVAVNKCELMELRVTVAALAAAFTNLTGSNGTAGAFLPTITPMTGRFPEIVVLNSGTSVALIYPNGTGTIGAGSAGASVSVAAKSITRFVCTAADVWYGGEAPPA